MVDCEVYQNALTNEETPLHDCNSFNDSGKQFNNSCEYGSCNRIIKPKIGLKEMKKRLPDKIIFSHLNINSLRNKFDSVKNTIGRNIGILWISEAKVDDSFPSAQCKI